MESNQSRPWLTYEGVQRSNNQIRSLSPSWSVETWLGYLKSFESSRRESLLPPDIYEKRREEQSQSIFEQFDHDQNRSNQQLCADLLSGLSPKSASVLRRTFLEGQTERQIASQLNMTRAAIHRIKARALSRLKKLHGDNVTTRRLMRGACDDVVAVDETFPVRASLPQLKEARVYDPTAQIKEFESIEHTALKAALGKLTETQKRVIYLHFWCDYTLAEIARDIRCGVNLVEQVLEAAVSRLKRMIVEIESQPINTGDPSCA